MKHAHNIIGSVTRVITSSLGRVIACSFGQMITRVIGPFIDRVFRGFTRYDLRFFASDFARFVSRVISRFPVSRKASRAQRVNAHAQRIHVRINQLVAIGKLGPAAADELRTLLLDVAEPPHLRSRARAAWLLPATDNQPSPAEALCDILARNAPVSIKSRTTFQTTSSQTSGAQTSGGQADDDTLLLISPLTRPGNVTSQMIERANAGLAEADRSP